MKIIDILTIAFALTWVLMVVCFCGDNCELGIFFGIFALILGGSIAQIRKILKERD